jgi:hypothetical protein
MVVAVATLVPLGCTSSPTDDGAGEGGPSGTTVGATVDTTDTTTSTAEPPAGGETTHAGSIARFTGLLPADTRGMFVIDVEGLLTGGAAADVTALLHGDGGDPALGQVFGAVGALAGSVDVPRVMTSALLAQTTDATDGQFLLATVQGGTIDEVVAGPPPTPDGTDGPADRSMFVDASGNHLALLPGGVLVVGGRDVVESVLDVADGNPGTTSPITPFLAAVDDTADISFVYGLPALFDADITPDRTLRGAAVVSGALHVVGGEIAGEVAFHTPNASAFVEAYKALDLPSTQGNPSEQPLALAEPVAEGLGRVVLTIPPSPLDPSDDEMLASRNVFKKLFVGMEAYDDAEGVADGTDPAWLDLVVKSERDQDGPPSPGSVFVRWEFRDQAAIDAFEANELPEGFTLAPVRFFESDDPEGEYFLALNLYNAGGGSIVSGARAEWDVFVHPPEGADPDAGQRPRFFIVDALAESVSADPANLVTPAEPLSHEIVDGAVISSVRRFENGLEVPVFESAFPVPDPDRAEVARFTREMAIGNDYIYWAHGVYDRVLYNATTFNYDAYFVDPARFTFTDHSRWAQYLKPTVMDAVYYDNSLEYVASPMANLDSDHLDITPEWLAELVGFTSNGHQAGLMRTAVEQLFRGESDALAGMRIGNETPSTFFNFEITDPEALEATLDLPPGHRLAPTTLLDGAVEGYYLTLSVYEIDDASEGTRAEWSVYTDDGSGRPPRLMVLDLMTSEVGIDPVSIINLPSEVRHGLADGTLSIRLASAAISFDASFATAGASAEALSLDWIEAGDDVCHLDGICDKFFYDAETLDVPVHVPAEVAVNEFSTPWNEFVNASPSVVFYRDNAQEYVVKRWYNLKVPVDELPFSGLDNRTHEITGTGSLIGRTSDIANSDYTYTGDALVDGDRLTFAIDQEVDNALGVGHIYTTGVFDLAGGTGTQTVVDCLGPALLCSDIVNGSTAFFAVDALDASDPDAITWQVNVAVDLGGSFGIADSASTFVATRVG